VTQPMQLHPLIYVYTENVKAEASNRQ